MADIKTISKYVFFILISLPICWIGLSFLGFTETEIEKDKDFENEFIKNYAIYAIEIPEKLDFAGDNIPLNNFDVFESVDREFLVNVYWQSQTLLFIKRANKYFPIIEKILKENDVPDDFKYLAVAESGLTNVVSPAGATGFWQFMKPAAIEYGLEVNNDIDERYNLEKSTVAACKYFRASYKKYQNWSLVAASYNMGTGGLDSQISTQCVSDYHDLLLNTETGRYLYRIVAIKTILSNPEKYGFHFRDKDLYQNIPVDRIRIDTTIDNLVEFSHNININYKVLKIFNPWLRKSYLPNKSNKEYFINIPKKGYRDFKPTIEASIDSLIIDTIQN
ncbi:MAG: lytic transglycosylase domain-containing protein [Bacteroidota bacterium]